MGQQDALGWVVTGSVRAAAAVGIEQLSVELWHAWWSGTVGDNYHYRAAGDTASARPSLWANSATHPAHTAQCLVTTRDPWYLPESHSNQSNAQTSAAAAAAEPFHRSLTTLMVLCPSPSAPSAPLLVAARCPARSQSLSPCSTRSMCSSSGESCIS